MHPHAVHITNHKIKHKIIKLTNTPVGSQVFFFFFFFLKQNESNRKIEREHGNNGVQNKCKFFNYFWQNSVAPITKYRNSPSGNVPINFKHHSYRLTNIYLLLKATTTSVYTLIILYLHKLDLQSFLNKMVWTINYRDMNNRIIWIRYPRYG